jgi:P4 family phage/plasmid primase-like protien
MQFKRAMAGEYKSSDPIVKFSLKTLKKGEDIERAAAIRVAVCIFKETPELDLESICEGIGHPDILEEVQELCAGVLAEKLAEDSANEDDTKDKDDDLDLPGGNSDPEYTSSEVDQSVSDLYSAKYSFVSRERATAFGASDEQLARMAVYCIGQNNCRRLRTHESWLVWTGSHWRKCDEGDIRSLLAKLGQAVESDCKAAKKMSDKDKYQALEIVQKRYGIRDASTVEKVLEQEIKTMQRMVSRIQSLPGLQAISRRMGDFLMVDANKLDQNECELVFNNLAWNAETGQTYRPRRESLATRGIEMNWSEPTTLAQERWKAYLDSLGFDEETLKFLKLSFGYASLGSGSEKRFWWFRGQGDTSKTTIIQLVARCLDSYAEVTQTPLWLSKGGSRPGHTDDLAALQGSRLVYADEFPKSSRFDDSLLKQITSGASPMRASEKGEKGITFKINFALFCSSNFDPQLAEDDEAAMRRLTTLTFKHKVAKKDKNFVSKYVADQDNRLAILKWVMEGAVEYLKNGLGEEPEMVKDSRAEFSSNQVSVSDQLQQLVVMGPSSQPLRLRDLLKDLNNLQQETRQRVHFTERQIIKTLLELYKVEGKKVDGHTVFDGLRLRDQKGQSKIASELDFDFGPDADSYGS